MSYPTVEIGKKKIIPLSGFERRRDPDNFLTVTAVGAMHSPSNRNRRCLYPHIAVSLGCIFKIRRAVTPMNE